MMLDILGGPRYKNIYLLQYFWMFNYVESTIELNYVTVKLFVCKYFRRPIQKPVFYCNVFGCLLNIESNINSIFPLKLRLKYCTNDFVFLKYQSIFLKIFVSFL